MIAPAGRTKWPHLLADLRAKRDALDQIIATVETHFVREDDPDEDGHGDPPLTRGRKRMARASSIRRGRPPKKLRRANERASRMPRQARRRSLPDDASTDAIVAQLRRQSPMKPGALAEALSWSVVALRQRLKPLIKAGIVTVTGATVNRLVHLGRTPAPKEGL